MLIKLKYFIFFLILTIDVSGQNSTLNGQELNSRELSLCNVKGKYVGMLDEFVRYFNIYMNNNTNIDTQRDAKKKLFKLFHKDAKIGWIPSQGQKQKSLPFKQYFEKKMEDYRNNCRYIEVKIVSVKCPKFESNYNIGNKIGIEIRQEFWCQKNNSQRQIIPLGYWDITVKDLELEEITSVDDKGRSGKPKFIFTGIDAKYIESTGNSPEQPIRN